MRSKQREISCTEACSPEPCFCRTLKIFFLHFCKMRSKILAGADLFWSVRMWREPKRETKYQRQWRLPAVKWIWGAAEMYWKGREAGWGRVGSEVQLNIKQFITLPVTTCLALVSPCATNRWGSPTSKAVSLKQSVFVRGALVCFSKHYKLL